jgi:inner membrane protein
MARIRRAAQHASQPSVPELIAVSIVLVVADQALRWVGGDGLDAGLLDETAHLMTGALIVAAIFRGARTDFVIAALAGSVLIDIDHVPQYLGDRFLTHGADRPYTHSLLTLVAIAALAMAWRRRRVALAGAFVGILGHFGRDLSESTAGVPLLWPWSYHSYASPHWIYLMAIGLLAAVAIGRALLGSPARVRRARIRSPAPSDRTVRT